MAENKKVIKSTVKSAVNCIGFQCEAQSREGIHERAHSNALSRLRLALKTNVTNFSLQILPYFFYNFFILAIGR